MLRRIVVVLRRGVALFIAWKILVYCFVLSFRCFEDLSIGLMRTHKCMKGSIHVCMKGSIHVCKLKLNVLPM